MSAAHAHHHRTSTSDKPAPCPLSPASVLVNTALVNTALALGVCLCAPACLPLLLKQPCISAAGLECSSPYNALSSWVCV